MKYIVVTGGVVSGLGKGITISSIGRVLQMCGLKTTSIKIDPYLNVDAGTMSPFEHGEVFVLEDGGEVDLDLGNYERFLDIKLCRDNNITTGKVYSAVIEKERNGNYLGKTVQLVPHITNEIQSWIENVAHRCENDEQQADICLIEVGGTVGDIESMIFLEALRQFQFRIGTENLCLFHVSLIPVLGSGEQKTKPTQHGIKELRSLGLTPNFIVCRSSEMLLESTKKKISIFCQVPETHVITVHDVSNIYHVPLLLIQQNLHLLLRKQLGMDAINTVPDITSWERLATTVDELSNDVKIAIVGKYTGLQDSYLSVIKALNHSCIAIQRKLVIEWVDASHLETSMKENEELYEQAWNTLASVDGVVIPGGFGIRGAEGMVLCAKYCRENRIPLLGVCLGMQIMVIEYARSILGWTNAHSAEFDESPDQKVIVFMPEVDPIKMGGTMRLGARNTKFYPMNSGQCSLTSKLYHSIDEITERHRHRYEVNPECITELQEAGLSFVGKDTSGERMEIIELPRDVHPFYVGTQYHPEFQSRPLKPSPPFYGLLLAASGQLDMWIENQQKK